MPARALVYLSERAFGDGVDDVAVGGALRFAETTGDSFGYASGLRGIQSRGGDLACPVVELDDDGVRAGGGPDDAQDAAIDRFSVPTFDPGRAAVRSVRRVEPLRHDALDTYGGKGVRDE